MNSIALRAENIIVSDVLNLIRVNETDRGVERKVQDIKEQRF